MTSAPTSRPPTRSFAGSPGDSYSFRASPIPSIALPPLSLSSGSKVPPRHPLPPIAPVRLVLPTVEEGEQWAHDVWLELDGKVKRRGGYSSGYRCWGCRKFTGGGPTTTCPHCGQLHGGVYHEQTASR